MKRILTTPRRILGAALADNITGEAAKAAYYLFFSIFPLIIAAFAFTGLVGGQNAFTFLMDRLETMAPGEGAEILEGFIAEITMQQRPGILSLGILLVLWSASNFFAALGEGLDAMFGVERRAPFLKRRGKALLMFFLGGALLVLGAGVILLGPVVINALGLGFAASLLRWPVGFLLIAGLMWLMYYILPNRDQAGIRREITIGALVATVVWMLATAGFNFYTSNIGDYDATYGMVGAVIVLLMWLFLTSLSVLLGGEVAHVLEEMKTEREDQPETGVILPH